MPQLFPSRGFRRTRERSSGLLFAFGVDDLSTSVITGQTLTFARNGGRTALDSAGRVMTLVRDQMPWSAWYNTTEATYEPVYDSQSGTTNLCLQSENFGTTWTAVGSPTRTAAAKKCGDLSLDLIGDDDGGVLEYYHQTVTYTGDAIKALSLFMAAGTSTSCLVRIRDTTASANRVAAVITWASGVPTVTMSTGTHLSTIPCAGGVYRFMFQSSTVTAANSNRIEVYPATTSGGAVANTGTVYAGGVQTENRVNPGSYIKTTTATVSTVADSLTASVTIPVDDFTVYTRVAKPSWSGLSGGATFPIVGQTASVSNGVWWIEYDSANGRVNAGMSQAGSGQNAFRSVPSTDVFEICAQYDNPATGGVVRVDVGAGFSSDSGAVAAISQWDSTTVNIGITGTTCTDAGIRRVIIAPGLRTLSQMRGLAV